MPAIQSIASQNPLAGASRERIEQLKARAGESLDDAITAVSRNLGRREAAEADQSLGEIGLALAAEGAGVHQLDHSRVLELISDPFADG